MPVRMRMRLAAFGSEVGAVAQRVMPLAEAQRGGPPSFAFQAGGNEEALAEVLKAECS